MTDIVERLRDHINEGVTASDRFSLRNDAADEIESLRAQVEHLRHEISGRPSNEMHDATIAELTKERERIAAEQLERERIAREEADAREAAAEQERQRLEAFA